MVGRVGGGTEKIISCRERECEELLLPLLSATRYTLRYAHILPHLSCPCAPARNR